MKGAKNYRIIFRQYKGKKYMAQWLTEKNKLK